VRNRIAGGIRAGTAVPARELIGKNPDIVEVFDLEASVSVASQLARLGLALD